MSVANPAFKQAGRSAASGAFDFDLPVPSGGRAEPEQGNLSTAKAGRQGQAHGYFFGVWKK